MNAVFSITHFAINQEVAVIFWHQERLRKFPLQTTWHHECKMSGSLIKKACFVLNLLKFTKNDKKLNGNIKVHCSLIGRLTQFELIHIFLVVISQNMRFGKYGWSPSCCYQAHSVWPHVKVMFCILFHQTLPNITQRVFRNVTLDDYHHISINL